MVYTITFNPALDYVVKVKDFAEGEVNRTLEEKLMPGGKGINVSVVLNNLGTENTALGFVAGFTGEKICSFLEEQNIKTDFVKLEKGNSRINVKLKAQKETEINAKGPEIKQIHIDKLYEKLDNLKDGDWLVLAGSIPKGISDSIYCCIMQKLEGRNIKIIVDAEKDLLVKTLPYKPFLVKPNHHELGEIFGVEIKNSQDAATYGRRLIEKGAENVFVSMSRAGGVFVTGKDEAIFLKAPDGVVINSTGAGDSAVAGFISGYEETKNNEEAFKKGICSGSASAFSEELAKKEEVLGLLNKIQPVEYL